MYNFYAFDMKNVLQNGEERERKRRKKNWSTFQLQFRFHFDIVFNYALSRTFRKIDI